MTSWQEKSKKLAGKYQIGGKMTTWRKKSC